MLALLALGCPGPEPEPQPEPVCDASVQSSSPNDGEDVIGTNATVRVAFDGNLLDEGIAFSSDPEASWVWSQDEGVLTLRPELPLEPFTSYSWTAELCGEALTGQFTTRSEGDETDPDSLADRTFAIDLAKATWVEPENGGDLMAMLFGGVILLGVQSVDGRVIDFITGVGEGEASIQQDPCYETVDFEPVDFRNPYFGVGPADMPLEVQGQDVILHELQLFGAFDAEGFTILDASLTAQGDLRDISGSDWESTCQLVGQYGLSCVECASDGLSACVNLRVEGIEADLVGGLVVRPVTEPGAECGPPDTGGPK